MQSEPSLQNSIVARSNSVYICTPEEADTRIIIRLLDSAENGIGNIIIWTVYSDTPTIDCGSLN